MTSQEVLCRYLEWDSEFFGRRIGTVASGGLVPENITAIEDWSRANRIDCLYFLANAEDQPGVRLAEDLGFRLVDIRLMLENEMSRIELSRSSENVRRAQPSDIPVLKRIAGLSHHNTRFYCDSHFPVERCNQMYETWIEKSCNGILADSVLVAESDGKAAGYISCKLNQDGTGEIGLAAVAANTRGKGLGGQLVRSSLQWFAAARAHKVMVVTQGRNIQAQRLYQGNGFFTRNMHLSYHRWYYYKNTADRG